MKKFSFKDFVELDVHQLLVVNGGTDCSGSSGTDYSSYGNAATTYNGSGPGSSYSDYSSYKGNYGGLASGTGSCSTANPSKDGGYKGVTSTNGGSTSPSILTKTKEAMVALVDGMYTAMGIVNGGSCSGVSKNDVYEEHRAAELKQQSTDKSMINSIDANSDKSYVCTGDAETDYRCDNWVQEVLTDAGVDYKQYMAGDAKKYCVQDHIDNLVGNKVKGKDYTTNVPTEAGVYVVYMNDGRNYTKDDGTVCPRPPHAAILVVGGEHGESSYLYDNSSGNANKGVCITAGANDEYISSAAVMGQFGYDSFYYQKVRAN